MSPHKKRKYENCTLCKSQVTHPRKANTGDELGDSEVLERIRELNQGNIDEDKMSMFIMCDKCRNEVNAAYKCVAKCQEFITGQSSISSNQLEGPSTQSESSLQNIIIVHQLPNKAQKDELETIFSEYGRIVNFYLKVHWDLGSDTFACITYSNEDEALRVIYAAQNKKLWYLQKPLTTVTRVSENGTPIDALPDVCLLEIFLHIDDVNDKMEIGGVCKRWKALLASSWSNITEFSINSVEEGLQTVSGLRPILTGCGRSLKSLKMSLFDYPISRLKLISKHCQNLENLQLQLYCDEEPREYQHEILAVFQKCTKLMRNLDGEFDYKILEHLPEEMLEIHLFSEDPETKPYFDLSKFKNLEALALYNFTIRKNSLSGLETLANLKHLVFYKSRVRRRTIQKLVNFEKLKDLRIPDCGVTDEVLTQTAQKNLNLEYLDISDNDNITDRSFQYVTRLPKLKTLWMKNLTQVTGSDLVEMHTVENLDVSGCSSISDWTLIMMIDKSTKLNRLWAAGACTWRLIINAEETIEMASDPRNLVLYTEEHFAKRWWRLKRNLDNFTVDGEPRDTEVDPCDWDGWYGDANMLD